MHRGVEPHIVLRGRGLLPPRPAIMPAAQINRPPPNRRKDKGRLRPAASPLPCFDERLLEHILSIMIAAGLLAREQQKTRGVFGYPRFP